MPRKNDKLLSELRQKIEVARRIVADQQAIVDRLIENKKPCVEAKGILRTYLSSLDQLKTYQKQVRKDKKAHSDRRLQAKRASERLGEIPTTNQGQS
jgi:hypothetical protein